MKEEQALTFDPFNLEDVPLLEIKRYSALFDIENWYSLLEDLTFPTYFFNLSQDQITHLLFLCSFRKNDSTKTPAYANATQAIAAIARSIDTVAQTHNMNSGIFARLSTRSPKDAVLMLPALNQILEQELLDIPPGDENTDAIYWYCAVIKAMKMANGEEAMKLLTNSSRVREDLTRWLHVKKEKLEEEEFAMNIVLRPWTFIHPKDEFRAFVYDGHLTAVSQYIDVCFFNYSESDLSNIRNTIFEFFYEKLQHRLPFKTCVLDLALFGDEKWCKLIECNPYFVKTGAALFNWQEDREILTKPPSPISNFALRVIETKEKRRAQGFFNVRESMLPPANAANKEKEKEKKCNIM